MTTELKVLRFKFTDKSTISELYLNGTLFCYTLEDPVRELKDLNKDGDFDDVNEGKVKGNTAIPEGTYDIILNMSNRFKKIMPLLLKVPGYEGVRIHTGNFPKDTEGCILVGSMALNDEIRNSRPTFTKLMTELEKADKITITIQKKL